MEILNDAILVTTQSWAFIIVLIGLIGCLVCVGPLVWTIIKGDDYDGVLFAIILVCIIFMAVGACAPKVPTGEYKYTVSITDDIKYKELIDKGYKFSAPVYDGLSIYEITGDPLQ